MARHFTAASGEYVDLLPGAVAANDGGPLSVAALWRATTNHTGSIVTSYNAGGFEVVSLTPVGDAHVWHSVGGSFRSTVAYAPGDWRLDCWTKGNGAGATVRCHSLNLTAGGGWIHTDYGTCGDAGTVPAASIRVGDKPFTGSLNGDVAALTMASVVWSDAEVETLAPGLSAWVSLIGATPAALWAFNQADVTDAVVDLTGGGADQVGRNGTTISSDPPGWSYDLSTPLSGALAATLPALSGSLAGDGVLVGTAAGTMPALSGALSGAGQMSGVLGGVLPALSGALVGAAMLPTVPEVAGSVVVRSLSGTVTVH